MISPAAHRDTREALHSVAAHVLARRRYESAGRFGLRATPGGFGTPTFGLQFEVVRTAGRALVHEVGGKVRTMPINGSTLRQLSSFVGTDLEAEFSAGGGTPALGDADGEIRLDSGAASRMAEWFALGWKVLDGFIFGLGPEADAATIQLWPEHFDAGSNVALPTGSRANIGFSPGDAFEPEPYAYFGPWGNERPGDPSYWNAPFGALIRSSEILKADNPIQRAVDFLNEGARNTAGS
ncbi:MAG TPA: hypothetical protein VNF71_12885 [Acidimicrobiales bacterium]|nr:hypothetical protein [Acidimicrobiales bacterium]